LYREVEQRLARLARAGAAPLVCSSSIGLEKESLRVAPAGGIAVTPHPSVLGSPLTHPYITTDYSEALLEFITPPITGIEDALGFLRDAHKFVYQRMGEEILWATSMPCILAGPESIPIAQYGSSNAGTMKTVYRRGLGHRYGRLMQVIAGVHFNYSLPEAFWIAYQGLEGDTGQLQDFVSASYFALIRNLQRVGWLVPYLFGASPAVCQSFMGGKPTTLPRFDESTYYQPYATSLRMGDIGYQNSKELGTGVKACYDDLDAYVTSLAHAIETPCPEYEKIGVVVNGEYEQLNANILQIENEYYSSVRPKQIPNENEKPGLALKGRGVRYIELRSLDVNAFHPLGIDANQLHFLEALMLFCLFAQSPPIGLHERREIDRNQGGAAHRGRDPRLYLERNGREIKLTHWARQICTSMQGLCEVLDGGGPNGPYTASLRHQRELIDDPESTPSARMLCEMRDRGEGFYNFAKRMSLRHREYFEGFELDIDREQFFLEQAALSWQRQREIEAADDVNFDDYLQRYFAQR